MSHVKALIFVALLACLATSVATTDDAIHDCGIHSSHALDIVHAAQTPFSIKRYLRSTATMVTSDHTDNFEERAVVLSLATRLKETTSRLVSKIEEWRWRLQSVFSYKVFKYLKLHQTKFVFESPNFLQWVATIKSRYQKSLYRAITTMLSTLARIYKNDADLANVLVAGKKIPDTKEIASELLQAQVQRWQKLGKSEAQVFSLLKLDKTKDKLFESPAGVLQWVAFVKFKYQESPKKATEVMLSTLIGQYKDDADLANVLVAGKKIPDTKGIATELLEAQVQRWQDLGKFDAQVFSLLKLDKTKDKLFESPVFPQLVAFIKLKFPLSENAVIDALFLIMNAHYTDDELTKVLAAGTKIPDTETIASKLQKMRPSLENWESVAKRFPSFGAILPDRN